MKSSLGFVLNDRHIEWVACVRAATRKKKTNAFHFTPSRINQKEDSNG